jgi:hypothetical protein
LNIDNAVDHVKHQLNDAFVIKRELDTSPPVDCVLEDTLTTSIDTTRSPNLGIVGEKSIVYLRKSVESRVKQNVKRKLISRSKRPPTDKWRLNDREFNELRDRYKFTLEGCCDSSCLNGHKSLPFYYEQNTLLDHDVSGHSFFCNPPRSLAIQCVE